MNSIDGNIRMNLWRMLTGSLALIAFLFLSFSQLPADADSDTRIKTLIMGKLNGLVSIHPERLAIEVTDGAVRISGSVASVGEQMTVGRLAGSVSGVTTITNDLSVRTVDRQEADILQEVTSRLKNRPKFRDGSVHVSVAGSEVTLSGTVKHNADKADAEDIAGAVRGVTSVVNRLQAETNGNIPDEVIQSKVRGALVNPVTFGVVRDLEVAVEDGVVTLKGSVRRHADRDMAERIALGVEGVTTVDNQVTVEGS